MRARYAGAVLATVLAGATSLAGGCVININRDPVPNGKVASVEVGALGRLEVARETDGYSISKGDRVVFLPATADDRRARITLVNDSSAYEVAFSSTETRVVWGGDTIEIAGRKSALPRAGRYVVDAQGDITSSPN